MATAKKAPAPKATKPAAKAAPAPSAGTASAGKKSAAAPPAAAKKATAAAARPAQRANDTSASAKAKVDPTPAKKAKEPIPVTQPTKPAKSAKVAPAAPTPAPAKAAAKPAPAKSAGAAKVAPAVEPPAPANGARVVNGVALPPIKGTTKDGIAYTKDFDAKFLTAQRALLLEERDQLTGQATRLEDEANQLIEESEMGDVQFDDEGGEGDTMVVERERDLALSAQARQMIADIDAALARLEQGTYGYSLESGVPIGRERLEAIPWATVLVSEKVGGIGKR